MSSDFWLFSNALYRQPFVEQSCLELQDADGIDVSLVLFCLYSGAEHGVLTAQAVDRACEISARWSAAAVTPMREIRRRLKASVPVLTGLGLDAERYGQQVKDLELEAERLQHLALQNLTSQNLASQEMACLAEPPPGEQAAWINFTACLRRLEALQEQEFDATARFSRLIQAARGLGAFGAAARGWRTDGAGEQA